MEGVKKKAPLWYAGYGSAVGCIFVASSEKGITDISISVSEEAFLKRLEEKGGIPRKDKARFNLLFREFDRYFKGRPVRFESLLDIEGTEFERSVWKAISSIPWGETRSYRWVAERAGAPEGARAAGGACGKNPVPIVIPCHRVLKSDGGLGGYTGGIEIKKALLRIEGISFKT